MPGQIRSRYEQGVVHMPDEHHACCQAVLQDCCVHLPGSLEHVLLHEVPSLKFRGLDQGQNASTSKSHEEQHTCGLSVYARQACKAQKCAAWL